MPCEKYQDALTDLAASGAEVVGVVREHLNVCTPCRSYLAQEQLLFASVDSGVRQTTNAPLPVSLLQRFQARMAQEAPTRCIWSPNLIYAAVAVATVAIILGIAGVNYRSNRSAFLGIAGTSEREAMTVAKSVPAPISTYVWRTSSENVVRWRRSVPRKANVTNRSELDVLVPPGQEAVLAEYARTMQNRTLLARARPLAGTSAIEPLVMAFNAIPELEFEPLPDLRSK